MKKVIFVTLLSLVCVFILNAQKEENDNTIIENKNKPEREEWLRDLGFGMFIHWSLDSQLGIVISHSMVGASDDYMNRFIHELPKTFDPYLYDGYRMAVQAKLAGAKYIVLTAKHHSGFCMWNTKTTDYKITNTPYKKDLFKEFVDGARKAGLAVGVYYSPEDFKLLYDNGITVNRGYSKFSNEMEAKYDDLVRKQTRELFTKYGKIDVLFIDGQPKKPCMEEAWKLQPDVVITRGAINSPEQTIPGLMTDRLWESNLTMGTQWQYKPTNDELKSGTRLIEILIETRAKGGNLLLNVGPRPDGKIADPEERRLTEIAAWNFINQEAIHNVRPWIVSNENNIWFTASKDRKTVYAIVTGLSDWAKQRKEFILGSVKATPATKVSVLGHNDKCIEYKFDVKPVSLFEQKEDGLHVSVVNAQRIYNNNKWPNPLTIKIENVEPALVLPEYKTLIAKVENGEITLQAEISKMGDSQKLKAHFEWREYAGFVENLYSTKWNRIEGEVTLSEPGLVVQKFTDAEKGKTYEYRVVIAHSLLTLYGDRLQTKK